MRHAAKVQHFNRPFNQRMWLMKNLVTNLVEHERITTTVAKAKELRRWAEKAVTLGKKGTLADRRLLMARIPNADTVKKVFEELAPRFKDRAGGYTRIYRVAGRPGDNAEMAIIEFLDAKLKQAASPETTKKAAKAKKALSEGAAKAAKKAKPSEEKRAAKKAAKSSSPKAEKKAKKDTKGGSKGSRKS